MKTLIVSAALIENSEEVLLSKRKEGPYKGFWEFPGGKVEEDESPERCLQRELEEELGIWVKVEKIEEVVWMPYEHFNLLLLLYKCQLERGTPLPLGCEEVRWFKKREIFNLPMPPADCDLRERLRHKWGLNAE